MTLRRLSIGGAIAILVACSVYLAYVDWLTWARPPGSINLHALQAQAFLDGRLDLASGDQDVARRDGRLYSAFPIGPVLIALPAVAVWGPQPWILPLLCVAIALAAWFALVRLLVTCGADPSAARWIAAGCFFGTGYWYCVVYAFGVWQSSLVVASSLLIIALDAASRRQPWRAGGAFGIALISRPFTIAALPLLLYMAVRDQSAARARAVAAVRLLAPILVLVELQLVVNLLKFGSATDFGYGWISVDGYEQLRRDTFGLFSAAYVPINLFQLFVPGLGVSFSSPDRLTGLTVSTLGTSLTAASPFLFLALLAPRRHPQVILAWSAAAASVLGQAFYYVNGPGQLNCLRYSLDYLPLLCVPMAMAVASEHAQGRRRVWQALILYAVALNVIVLVLRSPLDSLFHWWLTLWR